MTKGHMNSRFASQSLNSFDMVTDTKFIPTFAHADELAAIRERVAHVWSRPDTSATTYGWFHRDHTASQQSRELVAHARPSSSTRRNNPHPSAYIHTK